MKKTKTEKSISQDQGEARGYETHISDRVNEIRLKQQFMTLAASKIFGDDEPPIDSFRTEIIDGYQLLMEGLEAELSEAVKVLDKV